MGYVFGPVPSRRLGRSLGVDLVPLKTCSYDCIYCQVGKTTDKTAVPARFNPVEEVLKELEERLRTTDPDVVTFSGSGEPTLHSEIHRVIGRVKELTGTRVAVLTNGSLLWRPEVRERLLAADLVMPTLCTVFEETFQRIHRPQEDLRLETIVDGLKRFREMFQGELSVEVLLLKGINDTEEEIQGLVEAFARIAPDRIQLNTVVRPPSSSEAVPLDRMRLEEIRGLMGEKAEIIADPRVGNGEADRTDLFRAVRGMAERRPIRVRDAADSLSIPMKEAGAIVQALVSEGVLRSREHEGETYFSAV
ncbi:MAG: radical SAM protein [Deltaproteobacteria bacterium]|nr:radical SAM protein [Deltaproteobacteria bacterium]